MSTTPARRRATAVVVGVLLALTGVLLCKPWLPVGPQQAAAAPVDAAPAGTAPTAAGPATAVPATAVPAFAPRVGSDPADADRGGGEDGGVAPDQWADRLPEDLQQPSPDGDARRHGPRAAAHERAAPATAPFRTDADDSTRIDDATGLDGSGAPGCQERDRDTGSQPAVPPRSVPSYDHVSLLAERPSPDCRTVLSVVHTRPAVTAAPLTAPTPVELSVLRV
ncbi:hypothetical protein ACFYYR_14545 [Streptomyces sp. NPDC001922]|uniref:hypothetical protein n=1 Tax=Streptomyces sp. NPDC001922 TaxID=3364624 RepID=UPI003678AA6B